VACGAEGKALVGLGWWEEQLEFVFADGAVRSEPIQGGAALRAEFPAVAFAGALSDATSLAVVGAQGQHTGVAGQVVVLAADTKCTVTVALIANHQGLGGFVGTNGAYAARCLIAMEGSIATSRNPVFPSVAAA
jgi:hypothetical protein